MLITKMPGYSKPTIAIYPFMWHQLVGVWIMWAYKFQPDGTLKWMRHYVEDENGTAKAERYMNFAEANADAKKFNQSIRDRVYALDVSEEQKVSISLKAEKAITAEERLASEEQLMLNESIKRTVDFPKPKRESLILPKEGEDYRDDLYQCLTESPKIEFARLASHRITLRRKGDLDWSTVFYTNEKTGQLCFRERIASGFDLSGKAHWGETKAQIRALLLPRANQLLQLTSVQRMLDEALAKGQHVIVVGSFVFWYEEGKDVGWTVKSIGGASKSKDGDTIWKEGKIVSKNHGRIVVLPYIKENGELVQGHTKNSSKDGKAKPRHPDYYLELPFEVLDGDLMIGLFGELPYE
ncbi:hypothetical protein [Janthinobacterium sp. PAMC25594]|uniref:hypothetical protein n=1 Tax=Janthinobacterium sp. PAMC25594 TaxID=2861284 RepID=UPI001C625B55|nr:hypothetical protein [Janthinobacterium sp. PAMC25594]QYG06060.1 hypothetical protein KY494_22665 [Janthinobacterium sp. PAMC25594]